MIVFAGRVTTGNVLGGCEKAQAAPDAGGLAGDDRRLLARQEGDAGDQRDPALESHARATLDRDERARKAPIAIAITHRWTKPKVARW